MLKNEPFMSNRRFNKGGRVAKSPFLEKSMQFFFFFANEEVLGMRGKGHWALLLILCSQTGPLGLSWVLETTDLCGGNTHPFTEITKVSYYFYSICVVTNILLGLFVDRKTVLRIVLVVDLWRWVFAVFIDFFTQCWIKVFTMSFS